MGFYVPGPWEEDLKDIEENYLKNGEFLVGEVEEAIVAMGAFRKVTAEVAEIKRMRVHPDFQRRGFAQMILDRLESDAKKAGFKIMSLDTTAKQTAGIELYKKNGYQEIKRDTQTYPFVMIYYQKKLL